MRASRPACALRPDSIGRRGEEVRILSGEAGGYFRADASFIDALITMATATELKFDNPNNPSSKLLREGLLATKDREIVYVRPWLRAVKIAC
jgi:hypothetical protein